MSAESIFSIVSAYETDFLYRPVKVVEGYNFDQLKTVKAINQMQAARYPNGNVDAFGNEMFYYDIVTPRVRNAAKNLDLDTKDIQFRAMNGKDWMKAWLFRRDARNWMRERKFAQLLNPMPEEIVAMARWW